MIGFLKRLRILIFIIICLAASGLILAGVDRNDSSLTIAACVIMGIVFIILFTGFLPWLLVNVFHMTIATAKTGVKIANTASKLDPGKPLLRWLFTGSAKNKNSDN